MQKKSKRKPREYHYTQLGKKLKDLRIKRGFKSAEGFAYENEISRTQYLGYEAGANIQFGTLLKILNAMDISLAEFFKDFK